MTTRIGGQRLATFVCDVDAHGNQRGSKYNGHYKRTVPQFATCGETGDVIEARLRPDSETKGLKEFLLDLERIADRVILDAGFNGESTYVPLEENGVYYLMRLTIG